MSEEKDSANISPQEAHDVLYQRIVDLNSQRAAELAAVNARYDAVIDELNRVRSQLVGIEFRPAPAPAYAPLARQVPVTYAPQTVQYPQVRTPRSQMPPEVKTPMQQGAQPARANGGPTRRPPTAPSGAQLLKQRLQESRGGD
jgi:hypothetical protein